MQYVGSDKKYKHYRKKSQILKENRVNWKWIQVGNIEKYKRLLFKIGRNNQAVGEFTHLYYHLMRANSHELMVILDHFNFFRCPV